MSNVSKKRRNEDGNLPMATITPEEIPTISKSERPKLKARRTLLASAKDNEPLVSNETPQMKVLRQKMLERQSKVSTPKRSKTTMVDESKSSQKGIKAEPEHDKTNYKPSVNTETMTPQMREMYEKVQMRKAQSKGKTSKVPLDPAKAPEAVPEQNTSLRRASSRARSMGPVQTPVLTPSRAEYKSKDSKNRRKTMYIPSTTTQRPKSGSDTECTSELIDHSKSSRRSMTSQVKKNIAKERIEKLRRSLVIEAPDEDIPQPKKAKKSPEKQMPTLSSPTPNKNITPETYKTAAARMNALKERLQKETERNKEEINDFSRVTSCDSPRSRQSMDGAREPSLLLQDLSCDDEAMDWEPIQDDLIMQEIHSVRNELAADMPDIPMEEPPEECSLDLVDGRVDSSRRALYIVIDTNVFLSNIQAVEQARDTVFKTHGRPNIVIPWTVIRELDYIKDDRTNSRPEGLKIKARQAVRFLHRHFSDKHPRILGQTARDVVNNRELFAVECPDDEILQTCLQIQKSSNSVVLLSYDKNLCIKAMIHDIATLGRNDPLEKVDYLIASEYRSESLLSYHLNQNGTPRRPSSIGSKDLSVAEDIFEEIKAVVRDFLSVIVAKEMQNLYGENWEKYVIIPPPWTAATVLKCAIKHWMAAVNDSFIRRAEHILKELHDVMSKYEVNRRLRDVEHVLDLTYDLIQCLIIKKYPNLIQRVEIAVQQLRRKYSEAAQGIQEDSFSQGLGRERHQKELETRAQVVFQRFDGIYSFARDVCGAACESVGMSCNFSYKKLDPPPDNDHLKNLQPEIAASLNRLLLILSRALEELELLHKDHTSVLALYDSLRHFFPEKDVEVNEKFSPTDVYACLKYKEKSLRLGVPQLQQLIDHFCRLASFRCR